MSVSLKIAEARTIWIADAHRGDGKRFVVRTEEKLTAFVELESMIRPSLREFPHSSCLASKSIESPAAKLEGSRVAMCDLGGRSFRSHQRHPPPWGIPPSRERPPRFIEKGETPTGWEPIELRFHAARLDLRFASRGTESPAAWLLFPYCPSSGAA